MDSKIEKVFSMVWGYGAYFDFSHPVLDHPRPSTGCLGPMVFQPR